LITIILNCNIFLPVYGKNPERCDGYVFVEHSCHRVIKERVAERNGIMIVETESGKIEGLTNDNGFAFLGVPFAAPPLGKLRFRPPQPPPHWQGVRSCREFSAIPPQPHLGNISPLRLRNPQSEDCLYLNIYMPRDAASKLPVMFWIYGGGFVAGTANMQLYNGNNLAGKGKVIVVTANYRVGIPGFYDGNFGLQDQVAALRWIKSNIAAFGGNPDNITLFGESAGATSIDALMRDPEATGLFQRAICQSGTLDTVRIVFGKPGQVEVAPDTDINEILERQSDSFGWSDDKYVCQPVGSGEKYCSPVPLLIGWNTNEETIFTGSFNADNFSVWSDKMFGTRFTSEVLTRYKDFRTAWNAVIRYGGFALPSRLMADKIDALKQPVYFYRFNREAPEVRYARHLKCYHSSEISYVFGNPLSAPPPEDRQLSEQIISYWTNFARNGNPNGDDLPQWPQWHANCRRNIILDVPISFEQNCAAEDCDFFAALLPEKDGANGEKND